MGTRGSWKSILHDELGLERDRLEAGIELSVDFEVLVHIIVLMYAVLKIRDRKSSV